MKLLAKLILAFGANILALLAAVYFIDGVTVSRDPKGFLTVALLLTLVNLVIRPIAKMIFSPLILITLGLFTIVINAGILYIVDIYLPEIAIIGLIPLILTTLIISAVNVLAKLIAKII